MKRVNAVVIGAGAAGGIVAKQLSTAGLSVVLLERGKWYTANECRKDDLRNQRTTVPGNAFGPDDEDNPRVLWDSKTGPRTVLPSDGAYSNNAACVGGGTLSYGAMAWRYMPQDFRMRIPYGALAGSSLEDWPISYNDLEPYYEQAEYEIGVSGDYNAESFPDGRVRCVLAIHITQAGMEIDGSDAVRAIHFRQRPRGNRASRFWNRRAVVPRESACGLRIFLGVAVVASGMRVALEAGRQAHRHHASAVGKTNQKPAVAQVQTVTAVGMRCTISASSLISSLFRGTLPHPRHRGASPE